MGAISLVFSLASGFLAGPLSLLWGILSSAWNTEFGRTTIIAVGCLFGGWLWGWEHEHAVKVRAVAAAIEQTTAARDAEWKQKVDQANANAESRIAMAEAAAKAVPSVAALSDAELLQRCAASAACRDKITARRRLQGDRMPKLVRERQQAEH